MNESTKIALVKKIKEKPELSGIGDSVVLDNLEQTLRKYPNSITESDFKLLISETRSLLRKISGRFQKTSKKKFPTENYKDLLQTHSSTSERLAFYPELKRLISSLNASTILDLGCGLNPLALASKEFKYFACDIKQDELEILNDFFKKNNVRGDVFFYDLRKISSGLPRADVCLIFKVLDILGKNNHLLARKILQEVKCRTFLVSFSTKKLSGKPMRFPERKWFERILSDLSLPFKKIYSENEVFYLISSSTKL